ncbi:MAG: Ger(x)C family spore germination protein [Firmicutes bacterium]|nr:Ger(x)C family spore germination protein [Bacillota bacterium]
MVIKVQVKLLSVMLIIIMFFSTSCVTVREIDELNFIMATAFEYEPKTGLYIITVQVPKTVPKGEQPMGPQWMIYQAKGKSLFEAIRNLGKESPRRMYFGHCDIYIIGDEFAKKGIKSLLDFLQRDGETRVSTSHFLLAREPINKLLAISDGQEALPALSLEKLVEVVLKTNSQSPKVTVRDYLKDYMKEASYSVLPLVGTSTPDMEKKEEVTTKFIVSGSGVFKRDKLIGYLRPLESRGYLWAVGKLKAAIIVGTVTNKDKEVKVSYEIVSAESKVEPVIQGEELQVNIKVKATSHLGELDGNLNVDDPKNITQLEKVLNELIKKEVRMAVSKTQELRADVFDVGEKLHKFHPEVWKQVKGDWENVFANITFNIQVESSVIRTGRITELQGGSNE